MAEKEVKIRVVTESDASSLEDLNSMLDNTTSKANETGDALKSAFEDATQEVEELTEELANIELGESEADFDEISEALSEATDRAEELNDALNSIDGGGVSDTSSTVDDLTSSLDEATFSADELSSSMGLIESTMMMDMANQISALGDNAEGMAQSVNTAQISIGQLATETGVAEPQMTNLIATISNATFPQEEAMAYVETLNQMGVKADKLGDSATNMDRINDATGMGYEKVMLLTQGLTALGVSADDLPSSFNAIAYAESNVGGGAETLQQVLRRQAGTLNEYGMDVDATVVALSALQRQTGLTGMKLGSEFGQRLKECNGDLSQLEQSLGLQAGALSNASEETDKYSGKLQELADEEKEHKTLLQELSAWWEDISLQMAPITSIGGGILSIFGQIGSTALSINSLVTLGQTLRDWSLLQGVFSSVSGGLSGVKTALLGVGSGAKTAVTGVLNFAKTLATTVIGAVKDTIVWLGNMAKTILTTVLSAVKTAITGFLNLAKAVLTAGYNALKSAGMWLVEKAQVLASAVAGGVATVQNWLLAISEWAVASPILIIIAVIVALIAVLGYLYFNNEQVRNAIDGLGQTVMAVFQWIWDTIVNVIQAIIDFYVNLYTTIWNIGVEIWNAIVNVVTSIINTIMSIIQFIASIPVTVYTYLVQLITNIIKFGVQFITNIWNTAKNAVTKFLTEVSKLPSRLLEELNKMLKYVADWALTLPAKFWEAGVNAVKNFLSALGINSPGIMQIKLLKEISDTGERIPDVSRNLITNVGKLGGDIVDEFGNPSLSIGTDVSSSNSFLNDLNNLINSNDKKNGDVIVNVYGDIDNDKRVKEIVDAVRKELSWDNSKAGRTI